MKKFIVIAGIILIVIAAGILGGLYFLGDKIINEAIDMDIQSLSAEATSQVNNKLILQPEESAAIQTAEGTKQSSADQSASIGQQPAADSGIRPNPQGGKAEKVKEPVVTVEKMQEIKDEVTPQDKVSAAAMVMSRLTSGDMVKLKSMLKGGLTAEEKAEAKKIAYASFSSEEIKEIKEMYYKYMNK